MMSSAVRDFVKERLSVVSDENIDEKTLSNGRSGADVYSIKVESRKARLNGCYIVKVCPAASKREESEADKARRFHDYSPAFSEHLVKYIDKKCIDGRIVLINEQANKSVLHSTAFSELDGEHLAKYAQRVSRELLGVLNKDARIGGNVEDFFKSILHKQLGEGGRFSVRMRELLDRPEAECIVLDGTIYPNPFYFMTHIACWSNALSDLHLFKGAAHGDLHGLNLLASDESYSIIDYDSVSIDSYLLFDQAYFEFSVFLSNSRDNDLKPWNTMLERLVNPSMFKMVEPCGYYLEYMVRNAVCAGILDWVEETGLEASKDDIECQFLLARIAAGINFFCKRDCAEQSRQRKILLFIGYCFKSLFTTIGYHYNVNDVTTLSISSVFMNTEDLWENVFKFKDFLPVLFTDDHYTADDFGTLKSLWSVRWSLVVDVGLEEEEPIVYKSLLENVKTASVTKIALLSGENAERFDNTLNVLSARKPIDIKYANLWRICGKYLLSQLEKLMSSAPEVPLVLLFDCSRETISFRDQLIDRLCDLTLPGATRFAVLRAGLPENLSVEKKQLELQYYWHFSEHPGASLVHAAQCCGLYLQQPAEVDYSANIPSVDGICTFSKEDLIKFSSSIELVYAGCEFSSKNGFIHRGIDTSGRGDSLGEEFYKGGEVTWNDIANNRDLRLLPDKRYQDIKNRLISLMDESSPRIRKMQLIHGAGTGGTTLSKRILWDLKLLVPCVRLKKYVPEDTANILMEIYQRTGKRVLVTIEQGSTVITDEEFNMLIHRIDAENGKLLILMITRSLDAANDESLREDKNVLARLVDTMPVVIATYFMDHFSKYAEKRNNAAERIKLLENITGDSGKGQRTPFFYGFYTFQEEYNLLDRLQSTVAICTPNQRDLLNSLALVTMCSQNIDVTFSELATILNIRDGNRNIYVILDTLPTAISKLITIRIDGVRLCHKIIAENLLLLLYPKDDGHTAIKYVVYEAVCNYIKFMAEKTTESTKY